MGFSPDNLKQTINPWSWWLESSENQNGFINITNYKSANPKLEHKIVHEIAGYGTQIGMIEEMLELMISFIPEHKVSPEQKKIIERFKKMKTDIDEMKENDLVEKVSSGGIEQFIDKLNDLKKYDPELYKRVSSRLKSAL